MESVKYSEERNLLSALFFLSVINNMKTLAQGK